LTPTLQNLVLVQKVFIECGLPIVIGAVVGVAKDHDITADGVNDSLALRTAFAGIAMGGIGSDAAIESADAVIVHDNLDSVPYLFRISRKTQKRIVFNLCLSMLINFAAVALAITGVLNAVWGALFHNCGSVLVVVSAFLLLLYKGTGESSEFNRANHSAVY